MSDWTHATLSNLEGSRVTFTLDESGEVIVAPFDAYDDAMKFVAHTGPKFEYSKREAAIRVGGADGADSVIVPLPMRPLKRMRCTHRECDMTIAGHKPHYIPALKAANGPKELWAEIESMEVEGTKLTITTRHGTFVRYNHDPEGAARAVDFNREWGILRGPLEEREDGGLGQKVHLVSIEPTGPCTAAL